MVEITRELLRKRAEHNEMMLSNLEEVSLHQQNIGKIENLDVYCRHLKILYFQNNLISKMEGLNKLVELEYLNMAVNSVEKIEGLKRCESLNKLDMTLNFIDLESLRESMENLEWNSNLTDLYLTGNPCTDWANYRDYVIAKVETLMQLDGTEIEKSHRYAAKQRLDKLEIELDIVGE
jgi:protein TilB